MKELFPQNLIDVLAENFIIQMIQQLISSNQIMEFYDELLSDAEISPFNWLTTFLHKFQKNYRKFILHFYLLKRVIECYLRSANSNFRVSVFKWIEDIIEQDSTFDQQLIIQRIKQFIAIDLAKTIDLV